MAQPPVPACFPVTRDTVDAFHDWLFAPWVKALGLRDFSVSAGQVGAVLPQAPLLQFVSGAVCGQAIMAAVDTVAALAMATTQRIPKGTVYQHTHFVRPAVADDLRIEAKVLRFGQTSAFAEVKVTFAGSGELVADGTIEFAF